VTAADIERLLFADLPSTHLLVAAPAWTADALAERYQIAAHQGVLLRAQRLRVTLQSADAGLLRDVFRQLKFRRLLWRSAAGAGPGEVLLEIDGPMALFAQTTRYGLALAQLVPALTRCPRWRIEADVAWGRAGLPLVWEAEGARGDLGGEAAPAPLPDLVLRLRDELTRLGGPWRAEVATRLLEVPGLGLLLPDLRLRRADGAEVWLELLGYWSREAVFRRLDLLAAGVGAPVVLAVSERLRVAPELLGDDIPAGMVVFKGALRAKAVLAAAEAALVRGGARPPRRRGGGR
jgi:predicted nuclease of restriction endonuclease-like RecB superfamily